MSRLLWSTLRMETPGQALASGATAVLPSAQEVMVASGWNMLAADATHQHQLISFR